MRRLTLIIVLFAVVGVYSEPQNWLSGLNTGVAPSANRGSLNILPNSNPGTLGRDPRLSNTRLKSLFSSAPGNQYVGSSNAAKSAKSAKSKKPAESEDEKVKNAFGGISKGELAMIGKIFNVEKEIKSIIELVKEIQNDLKDKKSESQTKDDDKNKDKNEDKDNRNDKDKAGDKDKDKDDDKKKPEDKAAAKAAAKAHAKAEAKAHAKAEAKEKAEAKARAKAETQSNISKVQELIEKLRALKSKLPSPAQQLVSQQLSNTLSVPKFLQKGQKSNATKIIGADEDALQKIEDGSVGVKNKSESNAIGTAIGNQSPLKAIQNLTDDLEEMKINVAADLNPAVVQNVEEALPAFMGLSSQLPAKYRNTFVDMTVNITGVTKKLQSDDKLKVVKIITNVQKALGKVRDEVAEAEEKKRQKELEEERKKREKKLKEEIKDLNSTITDAGKIIDKKGNATDAIKSMDKAFTLLRDIIPNVTASDREQYVSKEGNLTRVKQFLQAGNKVAAKNLFDYIFENHKVEDDKNSAGQGNGKPKPVTSPSHAGATGSGTTTPPNVIPKGKGTSGTGNGKPKPTTSPAPTGATKIDVDPSKIEALGLSFTEIFEAIIAIPSLVPFIVDRVVSQLQDLLASAPASVQSKISSIIASVKQIPQLAGNEIVAVKKIKDLVGQLKNVLTPEKSNKLTTEIGRDTNALGGQNAAGKLMNTVQSQSSKPLGGSYPMGSSA